MKALAWEKIGNILTNAERLGQEFIDRAKKNDFCNYELVDDSFLKNLIGAKKDSEY